MQKNVVALFIFSMCQIYWCIYFCGFSHTFRLQESSGQKATFFNVIGINTSSRRTFLWCFPTCTVSHDIKTIEVQLIRLKAASMVRHFLLVTMNHDCIQFNFATFYFMNFFVVVFFFIYLYSARCPIQSFSDEIKRQTKKENHTSVEMIRLENC